MDIRKISIGSDYKNAMNYVKGQSVLSGSYTINHIRRTTEGEFQVWIEKDKEIFLWKSFTVNMPCSVEYNIEF